MIPTELHRSPIFDDITFDGAIVPEQKIGSHAVWSADPKCSSAVSATVLSETGVHIKASVDGPTEWMSLQLRLGQHDLREAKMIGFYAEVRSMSRQPIACCLRSGTSDGFIDTFFSDTVTAYSVRSSHADAITIDSLPRLPRVKTWREFIFFFPKQNFDVTLENIKIFAA